MYNILSFSLLQKLYLLCQSLFFINCCNILNNKIYNLGEFLFFTKILSRKNLNYIL